MILGRRLVLALSVAAATVIGTSTADPPRSADVPTGYAVVHFGKFYRSPAGQAALKQLQATAPHVLPGLERMLGVPLAHVETITAVLTDLGDRRNPSSAVLIVDLNTSHAPADLIHSLQEPDSDRAGLPPGVFPLINSAEASFTVAGDRRFTVFTTERARHDYVELQLHRGNLWPSAPGRTPLLDLKFRPDALLMSLERGPFFIAFPREKVRPLAEALAFTARADLDEHARIRLEFRFADAADVGPAVNAAEFLRRLLLAGLALRERQFQNQKDAIGVAAMKAAASSVKAATITRERNRLIVTADLDLAATVVAGVRDLVRRPTPPGPAYAPTHLKEIVLALHNHESAYEHFPPAAICDAAGKPLLSWRVAILPFLDQERLYRRFRLNEPWDSDHNKKLLAQMPEVYRMRPPSPKDAAAPLPPDGVPEKWRTHFRVFVGNGAAFEWRENVKMLDFTDGTAVTIFVATAAQSVPWTKPDELPYDPKKPPPPLLRGATEGPLVAFTDGRARRLPANLKTALLRKLITRNGGEIISDEESKALKGK